MTGGGISGVTSPEAAEAGAGVASPLMGILSTGGAGGSSIDSYPGSALSAAELSSEP